MFWLVVVRLWSTVVVLLCLLLLFGGTFMLCSKTPPPQDIQPTSNIPHQRTPHSLTHSRHQYLHIPVPTGYKLPPPPEYGENVGEPILDYSEHGGSGALESYAEDQHSSLYLLSAGYPCVSDDQCDKPLRCVHFSSLLTKVCSRVDCEASCSNLSAEERIECPIDSYIAERESDDSQQCCIRTCKCLPSTCDHLGGDDKNCSHGLTVIRKGNMPGNCCDHIRCSEEPTERLNEVKHDCSFDSSTYGHGDKWRTADCRLCHCKDGVAVCDKTFTCPLPNNCSNSTVNSVTLEPDQCCPICKGCLYLNHYFDHLQSWIDEESGCQTCTCTNGRVKCHTEMCKSLICSDGEEKVRKDGECCESCVCNLVCPHGFQFDTTGTKLCECADLSRQQSSPPDIASTSIPLCSSLPHCINGLCSSQDCLSTVNKTQPVIIPHELNANWFGQLLIYLSCCALIIWMVCFILVIIKVHQKKQTCPNSGHMPAYQYDMVAIDGDGEPNDIVDQSVLDG